MAGAGLLRPESPPESPQQALLQSGPSQPCMASRRSRLRGTLSSRYGQQYLAGVWTPSEAEGSGPGAVDATTGFLPALLRPLRQPRKVWEPTMHNVSRSCAGASSRYAVLGGSCRECSSHLLAAPWCGAPTQSTHQALDLEAKSPAEDWRLRTLHATDLHPFVLWCTALTFGACRAGAKLDSAVAQLRARLAQGQDEPAQSSADKPPGPAQDPPPLDPQTAPAEPSVLQQDPEARQDAAGAPERRPASQHQPETSLALAHPQPSPAETVLQVSCC